MALIGPVLRMLFISSFVFLSFVTNTCGSAHKSINVRSESGSITTSWDKRIEGRTLRAARLKSNVKTRSVKELLRHDHELHYLDGKRLSQNHVGSAKTWCFLDSPPRSASRFSAQLRLTAIRPTLVLEEIDDQLNGVTCHDSSIDLGFISEDAIKLAYKELAGVGQFLLITSHESCNHDGERNAYLVSEISIDEPDLQITLDVTRMQWRNAFQSLTVGFGGSSSDFEIRRHPSLRKRQDSEPSITSTSDDSTASSTISFPVPPSSSATPEAHDAHGDIGFQFLDKAILPPSLLAANGLTLHGPLIPQGLTVSCKNCTTHGTIDLREGLFTLKNNDNSNDSDDVVQFFESGYVELLVNDFSAHIELESTIQPSVSLILYTAPLPEIGIPGFQIPGVGIVGPIFKPLITFGVQVGAALDVTYGFDVTIPNNSSIIIDIANVTNSSITGFPDTTFNAIPFQGSLDNITLTLSTAFTPELLLGISVFDGHGEAGAGVFLDLPTIKATVSQVDHVDANCNPIANTSSEGKGNNNDLFGSLTNIVPEVDFDLGLVAQAAVLAGPLTFRAIDKYTAVSTHYTLPTACLSFNTQAKTFSAPTATKKSAAAVRVVNPFAGIINSYGRVQLMTGVLAFILGCFLRL